MGIWVVVLESVAGDDPHTIEPEDLDALAEELAGCYPRVSGGPAFCQVEFWVEESTAGGAVMHALRLWQAAIRELGMPPWDVVRAEARDAHAIEAGLIEWAPPDEDEPDDEFDHELIEDEDAEELEEPPAPAPRAAARPRRDRAQPETGAPARRAGAAKAVGKRAAAKSTPVAKPPRAKKAAGRTAKRR